MTICLLNISQNEIDIFVIKYSITLNSLTVTALIVKITDTNGCTAALPY